MQPIKSELTLTQQFELENLKRLIPQVKREDLEELFIEAMVQKFYAQNAFINEIKQQHGQKIREK
ncbi:hypothetical protein [Geminocystis sp. NIES-3709]|uniref:hypothetical protein n=1 Tax=Geminocystis sp. NIES-3709 TaxID=1617448 RepID=UPI0005FC8FAB|nr:hypothetical protein [Geminocystis sp. NIES-3709]BAQ65583.1 hypothetical protein GM3709_2348 [Geminocystis sp. NIES-3709]